MKLTAELRRLFHYVHPHRMWLTLGILLMAVLGAAEGLIALMIAPALDVVLKPSITASKVELLKLSSGRVIYLNSFLPSQIHFVWTVFAICLVTLFLVKATCEYFGSTLIQWVGHTGIMDLRNRLYQKLIFQPLTFFELNPTGRVMSAVINDVERLRAALSEYLADIFRQSFALLAFVSVLLYINWKFALASALFVPLVIYPVGRLGRKIRRSTENTQSRLADLSQILQETISGNRVVKAFGMEHYEVNKFKATARRMLRETMRWVRAYVLSSPLMDVVGALVIVMVLLYARNEIKHGHMTIGTFGAFVYSLMKAYEPVKRLGGIYQLFQQALGASTQVFGYLELNEEEMETPGAVVLPRFSRSIEFDNVGFAYNGGSPILNGISLTVSAGAVVAIVGQSGAGKSTLLNLLPRFHPPSSGILRIDGCDVCRATLRSLREQMAIVTQETILFNDTVWNNLCYGRPDMPEERVYAAARAAMAHDFITALPQGYQTPIGDRGQRLSGGQRQRIAIARALLKDAPILILDEATSELDSESELLVQDALNNLMEGRTVFVIAHRLSTIRRADVIVVIEDGSIRELGTHEELLAHAGAYARLYELQFHGEDPAARTIVARPVS